MDRTVLPAFLGLGVLLGIVQQVRSAALALFTDPTPGSVGRTVLLLGAVLFVVSTVLVA